jgi:hypothetical protein
MGVILQAVLQAHLACMMGLHAVAPTKPQKDATSKSPLYNRGMSSTKTKVLIMHAP